jgi:MoxR-like ATPase
MVREIASGRFIANGEAVLLLGPPGVGKRTCSRRE